MSKLVYLQDDELDLVVGGFDIEASAQQFAKRGIIDPRGVEGVAAPNSHLALFLSD